MRYLHLAALLFSVNVLYALPTGRYLGSEPNSAAPSHDSDDIFVDEYLQKLWDSAPPSSQRSPTTMAVSDHAHTGGRVFSAPLQKPASSNAHMSLSAPSATVPVQHSTGQAEEHHAARSPPTYYTDAQVVSTSGSSSHSGSSWSLPEVHLLSPIRWDSPPSSSQHSPTQMDATDHVHAGANARSAPVSVKHAAGHSPHPHHHTGASVVSESDGSSTHSASSWTHSDLHLAAQMLRNSPPLSSQHSPPQLRATDSAHVGHSAPSITEPAPKRLKKHHDAKLPPPRHRSDLPYQLEWIGPEPSVKGHDLHTQRADVNPKWFKYSKGTRMVQLKLPPVDRVEPLLRIGDVAKYQALIKHLDAYKLSLDEFIKQGHIHLEQQPDRWHKKVPQKAMKEHLLSTGVHKSMVAQFEKIHRATTQSNRKRQLVRKNSEAAAASPSPTSSH